MPRDEVLAGDTRAWLEQAAKDLRRVDCPGDQAAQAGHTRRRALAADARLQRGV